MNLLNKKQNAGCNPRCSDPLFAKLPFTNCAGCDTTDECQKASGDSTSRFDLVACYNVDFNFDYQTQPGHCPTASVVTNPVGNGNGFSRTDAVHSGAANNPSNFANSGSPPAIIAEGSGANSGDDPCHSEQPVCCGCKVCVTVGCNKDCTVKSGDWCIQHNYNVNFNG